MERVTDKERLRLSRYEVSPSGCWVWQGSLNHSGYGKIKIWGRWHAVHRAVYIALRGAIPEGLVLDHLCSNRACVNPDHLAPVTQAENLRRSNVWNRGAQTKARKFFRNAKRRNGLRRRHEARER